MVESRGGPNVNFLIFADVDIGADVYFQYLWMLKIMRISSPPLVKSTGFYR